MRTALLFILCASTVYAQTDIKAVVRNALSKAIKNVFVMNDVSATLGVDKTPQLQKANEGAIEAQRTGDILQEATRLLVEENGANILSQIGSVDAVGLLNELGGAKATVAPGRKKRQYGGEPSNNDKCIDKSSCERSFPFRSISGFCNNDGNPELGSTFHQMRRFMGTAKYDDGFNSIRRRSANGGTLPSAREVSNKIFKEASIPAFDSKYSHMLQQFGQFIAHDVVFTPTAVGPNNAALNCSSCDSGNINQNCAPIEVPNGDEYFPSTVGGQKACIRLTRGINGQKGVGQRAQINQDTHFLDMSVVYGSDDCVAKELRTFSRGNMKMYTTNGYTLPPQATNDSNCQSAPGSLCFLCGDSRNSLHPGLIPLHTIYLLQHNKWANEIAALRPTWSENSVYHETRRLMVATWQYHAYSSYLPKIIGNDMMNKLKLTLSGLKYNFDARVNPSVSVEFCTSAFRFGHSQVRKDIPRVNQNNVAVGPYVNLGNNTFYTDTLYDKTADVFTSARGMVNTAAMAVDRQFSFPIRNQLFEIRNRPASGIDLSAVNIQRGREEGVQPYNEVRPRVGLSKVTSFDQLKTDMSDENVQLLKNTYQSVDDIDLYVGLLLEKPKDSTALLGPTGSFIIADQFDAWKRGDRFFVESLDNEGALTPAEFNAIKNFSFAQLVCENVGMAIVQQDPFVFGSPKVSCTSFPKFPLAEILFA